MTVACGKVKLNGQRVKAVKAARVNDALRIAIGPYEHAAHCSPAPQAVLLYEESASSQAAHKALATQLAAERYHATHTDGRPRKK